MTNIPLARRSRAATLIATVVLLVLAGVLGVIISNGGLGSHSSSSASTAQTGGAAAGALPEAGPGSADARAADSALSAPAATGGSEAGSPQAADTRAAQDTALAPMTVRTAWLGAEVTNLVEASGKARAIVGGLGGAVLSENIVTARVPAGSAPDAGAQTRATPSTADQPAGSYPQPLLAPDHAELSLTVPVAKLDSALTQLSGIGTVSYRSSSSQDVTTEYVRSAARLDTMRASVERVRALLAGAKDLTQVVTLESELTRRQSDLESLQRQVDTLKAQSAMSTVTLSLWTPTAEAVTEPATDDSFVAGLRRAGAVLSSSLVAVVVGLAALAPWLLIAGLVLLVVARLRARQTQRERREREARDAREARESAARERAEEAQLVGAVSGPDES